MHVCDSDLVSNVGSGMWRQSPKSHLLRHRLCFFGYFSEGSKGGRRRAQATFTDNGEGAGVVHEHLESVVHADLQEWRNKLADGQFVDQSS